MSKETTESPVRIADILVVNRTEASTQLHVQISSIAITPDPQFTRGLPPSKLTAEYGRVLEKLTVVQLIKKFHVFQKLKG
jgi:hypothetical protein